MSWEDDEYTPELSSDVVAAVAAEEEVKDKTWEELAESSSSAAGAAAAAPEKLKPKHLEKQKLKEREAATARERAEMARLAAEQEGPLSDPAAERKRLEALQLKADMAAARDALGVGGGSSGGKALLSTDTATLVSAISLTDKEGFTTLGKSVAERVHEMSGRTSLFAMRFYNALLGVAGDKLTVDDLKALESAVAAARNKKLTAERAASKPSAKKKGGPKPFVERATDYDDYGYDEEGYEGKGVAAKGNSGNVAGSMAAAGYDVSAGGAADGAEAGAEFTRTRHAAEEDFM